MPQLWGTDVLTSMTADSFSPLPLLPFLKRIADGTEPSFVKSEEPSEEDGTPKPGRPVRVVARTLASSLVEDESLDVLFALYAGDKEGPPTSAMELAAMFHSVPSIRVALMNATANAFNHSRFPMRAETQYFALPASAAGRQAPIPYVQKAQGDPKALDVAQFFLKHVASPADSEGLKAIRKLVKRAVQQERENSPFAHMLPDEEKKKKKKRKRKGSKGGATKEEL